MQAQSIHEKLKELRKTQGLTQLDLANQFNVTKTTISKSERDTLPSDKLLMKYSQFFNIPFVELVTLKLQEKIKKYNIQNSKGNLKDLNNFLIENDVLGIPYFESMYDVITNTTNNNNIINISLKKNSYSKLDQILAIKFTGESMNKIIANQSIVIIDKGANIQSGDIVAYQFDNDCGIKRFIEDKNMIKLEPESIYSEFQERIISKENIDKLQFKIFGKVIDVKSNFNQLNHN